MSDIVRVVYHDDYGGFMLSDEALALGREVSGNPEWGDRWGDIPRHDPTLAWVVEHLGERAGHDLKIRELPRGTVYRIDEYDGWESVVTIDEHKWSVADDRAAQSDAIGG